MLFHYTNISSLKNIINSNELWFTNIAEFNDTSEYIYTVELLCKEMSLPDNSVLEILELIKKEMKRYYVCCFCADGKNLHLWKNYGNVRIGFEESELMSEIKRNQLNNGFIRGYFNPRLCEYNETRHINIIRGAIRQWKNNSRFSIALDDLSALATLFKKSSFREENETRLVVYLNKNSDDDTLHSSKFENHLKLKFYNQISSAIKSIKFSPSLSSVEIENFKHHMSNCKLGRSLRYL